MCTLKQEYLDLADTLNYKYNILDNLIVESLRLNQSNSDSKCLILSIHILEWIHGRLR